MQLSVSILTSAALQIAFVACALLGSWQVETPSLHFISDHSTQHIAVYLPPPEVKPDPVIEPPQEIEDPIATAIKETRDPKTPPAIPFEEKPKPKPKKKIVKAPQKLEQPPKKELSEPKKPDAPTLKTLVASKKDDAPSTTAPIADEASTATSVTAATLTPTAPTSNPVVATTSQKTSTSPVSTTYGQRGDVDRAGILKSYKRLLFKTIDKKKSVPRAARRARLEGTVYLSVTLDEQGNILGVKVRKSSGHKTLDEGAVDTMRSLKKLPAPPNELGWSKKTLTIPIRYKIK